ncbi:hypothetical protein PLICRDRAFT_698270 [Plicaturopsis crispa FD-325 SS-3]|nr:hypothetical protein PLICRDRAFT_698270 [Plicaturopsis crispa FD-325 SS-3]
MLGQSIGEYAFIRTVIFGFRSTAPLSVAYLAVRWMRGQSVISWSCLYPLLESAFYLLVYLPRHRILQKPAIHPSPMLDRTARETLFERCRGTVLKNKNYPTEWFAGPDIKRENVTDWLLWSFFSAKPDEVREDWKDELEIYTSKIEEQLGRKLESGFNKDAQSMRLTLDPVVMCHRPLVWYMIVGGIDLYTSLRMLYLGFHHYASAKWFRAFPPRPWTLFASKRSVDRNLSYWYRPHRSKDKLPIMFIHGIGIGFWPYVPFFKELIDQDPDVGILAIEILSISMRITTPPLSSSANCEAISRILDSLGLQRVVICSHSYGTVVTAHMLHSALSDRVAAALLVDPIPFLLHLPNVAYNFVYRKPRTANEWELWYFASRDPDISRALSRHFFWAENVLWKEELEDRQFAVALSGEDQIVHAQEVRRYLTGEEEMKRRWSNDTLEVLFYPGLDHATIFDVKERRKPLEDILRRFVRET